MIWKTASLEIFPRRLADAALALSLGCCLLFPAVKSQAAEAVVAAKDDTAKQVIGRLITQLGSDEYLVRQRAERELLRLGFAAYDALTEAEQNHDLEIATRARYLAKQIQVQWVLPADPPQVKNVLRDYGEQPETGRRAKVDQLLQIPNQAGWEAICRVIRYDRSRSIAKQTAAQLLDLYREDDPWRQKAESIRAALADSDRAAAAWIVTRVHSLDEADAALAEWDGHLAAYQALRNASTDQAPDVSLSLMRQKFSLLNRLDRHDDALEALRGMIALERGNPENLAQFLDWLGEEQAWPLVDELAERFEQVFAQNAKLLYQLAELYLKQGDPARAADTAQRALAVNPKAGHEHYNLAINLQRRGLTDWAVGEFRRTIEIGPAPAEASVRASIYLSDLLHDQGRDLDAAQVVETLLQAVERDPQVAEMMASRGRPVATMRGSMEFYFSLHEHRQANWKKEREHLDRAIAADPTNADVLIAMYRLPEADADFRRATMERIQQVASLFRRGISREPDEPTGYNQLAWLIANTEGDFDEATRCSHKSLELEPGSATYLDTLAHCYYAKRDYKNAVKYQQQAAELEPHMNLITKQLKVFQQALKDSQPETDPPPAADPPADKPTEEPAP